MLWLQEFPGFAVHWGFNNVLFAKRELDVSDTRKSEQDYRKMGVSPKRLYEPRMLGTVFYDQQEQKW